MAEYKNAASHKRTMALKSFSRHGQARLEDRRLDSSPAQLEDKRKPQGPYAGVLQKVSAATNTDLTGVKIHTNSPEPARIDAHGFTRGNEIHLAPGQEKHLPHELGHVVQQMAGKVKPTGTVNGLPINDHPALEREATEIGNKAFSASRAETSSTRPGAKPSIQRQAKSQPPHRLSMANGVIQRAGTKPRAFSTDRRWVIKATSNREAFVYKHAGSFNLNEVMPESKLLVNPKVVRAEKTAIITDDTGVEVEIPVNANEDSSLVDAITAGQKTIIMIENITYKNIDSSINSDKNSNENNIKPWIGDVKIGSRTKSKKQYEQEGAKWSVIPKIIEHLIKDYTRGNRKTGYDFENYPKFQKYISDNSRISDEIRKNIKLASGAVADSLQKIRDKTGFSHNITFVGSSILFLLDIQNPASSTAKIIDPDHPVILPSRDFYTKYENQEKDTNSPYNNMPKDLLTIENFKNDYSQFENWFYQRRAEYFHGLNNLIELFRKISG